MPIRVHNFGGVIGWNAKKYIPWVASESYLKLQFVSRRRSQKEYIAYFMSHEETEACTGWEGVFVSSKKIEV